MTATRIDTGFAVRSIADLSLGDHVCGICEHEPGHAEFLGDFIRHGLEQRQKVLYIVDGTEPSGELLQALRQAGVDVTHCEADGPLVFRAARDAYLRGGSFVPDRMVSLLGEEAARARQQGFSGLRVTGEMSWALQPAPGVERLIEYEARLNQSAARRHCVLFCQYDRRRFPPGLLLDVLATHPLAMIDHVIYPNLYYMPAEDFLGEHRDQAMLRNWLRNLIETSERTAALEAANRDLESFTYSVSHDLRAPLRHIDGFSRVLMEEYGPQLDENARHYLARVRAGTERMGRLIEDLLKLSRLGRHGLRLEVVALNGVVDEVLRELEPETQARPVEWDIGPLPYAECDPLLVRQVFYNLLSNALKFTRPRQPARIEVGQSIDQGRIVLHVRDNGVGFDLKYADKLFGVFQRLHRQEEFEGTGIGLATVRRIVSKHDGEIWVDAQEDRGATFYFTLGGMHAAPSPAQEAA